MEPPIDGPSHHPSTPDPGPTDWELVVEARTGSERAFRELVERHTPMVLDVARRRVGFGTFAEDIAQEAFVRLFRSLGRIRRGSELAPWLLRVTSNLCVDALRRRQRFAGHLSLDRLPGPDQPRAEALADQQIALEETRRLVWDALDRLDGPRRDVVVLRYLAGWSYGEIAEILGCAPGTVASRLHRAIRDLGAMLDADRESTESDPGGGDRQHGEAVHMEERGSA